MVSKSKLPLDQPVEVNMEGILLKGFGAAQLLHLYKEVFLRKDYAIKLSTKTPLILDLGSNIGSSIAFFKRQYPNAKIIGFEPHPILFKVLQENIKRNKFEDVELHNCAVGDKEGHLPFYVSENPGSMKSSMRADRGGNKEINVPVQKASELVSKFDHIDLIKIDVEGAEKEIFQDLVENEMISKPLNYIVEYHLNLGKDRSDLSKFLKILEDNGYDYHISADRIPGRRFQDILIHCYHP